MAKRRLRTSDLLGLGLDSLRAQVTPADLATFVRAPQRGPELLGAILPGVLRETLARAIEHTAEVDHSEPRSIDVEGVGEDL